MKKYFIIIIYLISTFLCYSQDLITGDAFLTQVSEHFTTIMDYRATIEIRDAVTGDLKMTGTVIYKRPDLLRIDFSRGQVFVSNSEGMLFYTPEYSFVLKQDIEQTNTEVAEIVKGLDYLENTYSASFVDSPEMMPLEENSEEMVYKLNLFSSFARFREIEVSINSNMMIRRIITNTIIVDYKNIQINTNLLKQQFDYIPPSSAVIVQNFLY
jgi:outer membrane lipoprotein-sorting protein